MLFFRTKSYIRTKAYIRASILSEPKTPCTEYLQVWPSFSFARQRIYHFIDGALGREAVQRGKRYLRYLTQIAIGGKTDAKVPLVFRL